MSRGVVRLLFVVLLAALISGAGAVGFLAWRGPWIDVDVAGATVATRWFALPHGRWPRVPRHAGFPRGRRRIIAQARVGERGGRLVLEAESFTVAEVATATATGGPLVIYKAPPWYKSMSDEFEKDLDALQGGDALEWDTLDAPAGATDAEIIDRAIAYLESHARAGR